MKKNHGSFFPKLYGSLILLCLASNVMAQNGPPYSTKDLGGVTIKEVELSTNGGSLTIMHEAGASQRIEVYIRGNDWNKELDKTEIEALLSKYEIITEMKGTKLVAKAKKIADKNEYRNSLSISFKVYAPVNVNTMATTSGGSIHLNEIDGKHTMATSGGSLHLEGVKGEVNGATSGGSIHLSNSDINGELATSGGSISANNSRGRASMNTSGGSISIENLDGNFSVGTSGGSITASGIKGTLRAYTGGGSVQMEAMACNLDAGTNGGNMQVGIAKSGYSVNLTNTAGNIELRLPAASGFDVNISANKISTENMKDFSGDYYNSTLLRGKVRGGGSEVKVVASSGKVSLKFDGAMEL